jgi:DNA repair protein RecO (recombination protein O)
MPRFKEQAVCIRLIDYSETSQIVALLTEGRGKLRGIAKGSKRASPGSVARFSGGIELLTLGQVVGIARPSSDLANITEWDLQQPHRHLREDLHAQRMAFFAADLVHAMLADHDPHPNVFAALTTLYEQLASSPARDIALLTFQWKLLEDCGYRPQLDKDARSGEALHKKRAYVFDPNAGGLVDEPPRTANNATGPWRVRRQTVDLLNQVAAGDGDAGDSDPEAVARANRLLCVYMRTILDRQLPTMRLLLGDGG